MRARSAVIGFAQAVRRVPMGETLGYAAAKIAPGIQTVLLAALVIRLAGESTYGEFAVSFAFATVGASLSVGWLRQSILRFSARRGVWGVVPAWLHLVSYLLPATLVAVLYGLITGRGWAAAVASGAMCLATSLVLTATSVLMIRGEVPAFITLETVRSALGLVLPALIVWATPFGATGVALTVAASSLVYLPRYLAWARERPDPGEAMSARGTAVGGWWQYGWPLSVWLGLSMFASNSARLAGAAVLGPAAAGLIAAVGEVSSRGVGLALLPVSQSAVPRVMNAWNGGGRIRAREAWHAALAVQAVLMVVILIVSAVAGGQLTGLLLGVPVDPWLFLVLVLAACGWEATSLIQLPASLDGRTRSLAVAMGVAAVLSFVLAYLGAAWFGPVGAAGGMTLAIGIYLILVAVPMRRASLVSASDAP